MIQAILFDLDGTLIDRQASLEPFLRAQFARCLAESGRIEYAAFRDRFLGLDNFGYTPRRDIYQTIITEHALDLTADALVNDHLAHSGDHSVVFPDAYDLLKRLRSEGYKLGIITNGSTAAQSAKIRNCCLYHLVDTVLISEQEGVYKPDAAIFLRAAERLSVTPAQCIFVGDHPAHDVHGAMAVGMVGVWKRGLLLWPGDLSATGVHVIVHLADLPPIVYEPQ